MLRTLVRDKGILVAESADWLRRMQKSLDQMNVRVHRAVSESVWPALASGTRWCRRAQQVEGLARQPGGTQQSYR